MVYTLTLNASIAYSPRKNSIQLSEIQTQITSQTTQQNYTVTGARLSVEMWPYGDLNRIYVTNYAKTLAGALSRLWQSKEGQYRTSADIRLAPYVFKSQRDRT